MLEAYPNILGGDLEKTISYKSNQGAYISLEPRLSQIQNIYFMESVVRLEDNIWDFIDVAENEISTFEIDRYEKIFEFQNEATLSADRKLA